MIKRIGSADPVAAGKAPDADNIAPGEANGTIQNSTNHPQAQPRPIPLPVDPDNIPETLKSYPQWVLWKYVWNEKKWTKPPFQPNGYQASKTNPQHYSEFAQVVTAYEKGGFDGIGFVLTANDPFVAIDIDHCFVGGAITEEAAGIIETLKSYTERSPSGEGVRIFVKGTIPRNIHKEIEIYSHGSYVTVTGQRWRP